MKFYKISNDHFVIFQELKEAHSFLSMYSGKVRERRIPLIEKTIKSPTQTNGVKSEIKSEPG